MKKLATIAAALALVSSSAGLAQQVIQMRGTLTYNGQSMQFTAVRYNANGTTSFLVEGMWFTPASGNGYTISKPNKV